MAEMQVRLSTRDADIIANALAAVAIDAEATQDVSRLVTIEARLRHLAARARERAGETAGA